MHTAVEPGPHSRTERHPRTHAGRTGAGRTRGRRVRTALSATTAAALAATLGVSGAHASAAKAPAPPVADLACRVFIEQDNYSSPLNRHGNRTSTNEIKGVTVGCSSPNGAFAPGNRARNPVLLSNSYTSTG